MIISICRRCMAANADSAMMAYFASTATLFSLDAPGLLAFARGCRFAFAFLRAASFVAFGRMAVLARGRTAAMVGLIKAGTFEDDASREQYSTNVFAAFGTGG